MIKEIIKDQNDDHAADKSSRGRGSLVIYLTPSLTSSIYSVISLISTVNHPMSTRPKLDLVNQTCIWKSNQMMVTSGTSWTLLTLNMQHSSPDLSVSPSLAPGWPKPGAPKRAASSSPPSKLPKFSRPNSPLTNQSQSSEENPIGDGSEVVNDATKESDDEEIAEHIVKYNQTDNENKIFNNFFCDHLPSHGIGPAHDLVNKCPPLTTPEYCIPQLDGLLSPPTALSIEPAQDRATPVYSPKPQIDGTLSPPPALPIAQPPGQHHHVNVKQAAFTLDKKKQLSRLCKVFLNSSNIYFTNITIIILRTEKVSQGKHHFMLRIHVQVFLWVSHTGLTVNTLPNCKQWKQNAGLSHPTLYCELEDSDCGFEDPLVLP